MKKYVKLATLFLLACAATLASCVDGSANDGTNAETRLKQGYTNKWSSGGD